MSVESQVLEYLLDNMASPEELFKEYEDGKPIRRQTTVVDDEDEIQPLPCQSFEELLQVYREDLFLPQSMVDTLAVILATTVSTYIGGDEKLWFYVMGPSGSGKSTLCSGIASDKTRCISIDKFTGFLSGFKLGKSKKDFSLINDINNKTVIIKDFTAVLALPKETQEKIFGELRFLSDGYASDRYLNGQGHDYKNLRFSMICGVTDEILTVNRTGLGERFLMVDITDRHHGCQVHVKKALSSIWSSMVSSFPVGEASENGEPVVPPDRLLRMKRATLGFMNTIHSRFRKAARPEFHEQYIEYCTSISRLVATIRGKVKREHLTRDLVYRPRSEIGNRLGGQLLKAGLALSIVFDSPVYTNRIMRITRKVARDTARGFNFEIVEQIANSVEEGGIGLDADQLSNRLGISKSDVVKRITDLKTLGLIDRVKSSNNSGRGGRQSHIWQLVDDYRPQWKHLVGVK